MDYPGKVITKTQVTPTQTSASGNWTLDDQAAAIKNNNWPVALVPNPISKSLRFNSADSAYLNRTPASASNRKTWTWSGWVKRSTLGGDQKLFQVETTNGLVYTDIKFASDIIYLDSYGGTSALQARAYTNAVYRDVGAWYHVVVVLNTPSATAADRAIIYVNGVRQAVTISDGFDQDAELLINTTNQHRIGADVLGSEGYFGGYLTEINFVDGQALTPSDFGLTNPQTGQWIPKKYTGTYGTNGFYLNFKDATSTTTLGYDYSGNANNWTTNNFSVTAGSGNDSLTDVPTPWVAYSTTGDVGGVVRGNYATLNPLNKPTNIVLANGNLQATNSVGAIENVRSTMPTASTYSYWEVTASVVGSSLRMDWGGILSSYVQSVSNTAYLAGAGPTGTFGANWDSAFRFYINGSNVYSSGTANLVANDVVMFAHDSSTGKIWVGLNGTWYNSGNPAAGTGNLGTLNAEAVFPAVMLNGNVGANGAYINFGQRPFAYTPPAGFRSLCTTNLPATTIGFGLTNQADDYFDIGLVTGSASVDQTITTAFAPDFYWSKNRNSTIDHGLYNTIAGGNKYLSSNATTAETTTTASVVTFNSTGLSLKAGGSIINDATRTYVGWLWRAGGTGVTNTAGSITSTVSANTTAGFSIVTWTGNGSATASIGHGLGVALAMVITKNRSGAAENWLVKHRSLSSDKVVRLNTTDAEYTPSFMRPGNLGSTTVIQIAGSAGSSDINTSGSTYVSYCFAAVAGYSAFGSYTGNASTDGPFIYLGFRPKYILVKQINTTRDWKVYDAVRNTYNIANLSLAPNLSDAEGTEANNFFDFLSNGFKIRSSGATLNDSGGTFIYACFAESPFQFSNAR